MRTKIIITYGPSSEQLSTLREIIKAGADVIRVNLKYCDIREFEGIRKKILKAGKVSILIDIKRREKIKDLVNKKFDYLAISFAENPSEIERIRKMFSRRIKIISKIETKKGVKNLDKLIKVSDGIMIARGDLGRSISIEKVPKIQKMINKICNRKKIISITATEMMPSMTQYKRPSRAEVTDVFNAVLEKSEYLLLAEETAVGRYPILTVKNLKKIIKEAEK